MGTKWSWVLLGVLATALLWWTRTSFRNAMRRRRFRRAREGESAAEQLLRTQGYEVLARQPTIDWHVRVDGDVEPVVLRADYLVARRGRTYVVDVKTGRSAPSLATSATRRQLLEYGCAYGADAVLLVDMEARAIRRVAFTLPSRARSSATAVVAWMLLGALVGALVARSLRP